MKSTLEHTRLTHKTFAAASTRRPSCRVEVRYLWAQIGESREGNRKWKVDEERENEGKVETVFPAWLCYLCWCAWLSDNEKMIRNFSIVVDICLFWAGLRSQMWSVIILMASSCESCKSTWIRQHRHDLDKRARIHQDHDKRVPPSRFFVIVRSSLFFHIFSAFFSVSLASRQLIWAKWLDRWKMICDSVKNVSQTWKLFQFSSCACMLAETDWKIESSYEPTTEWATKTNRKSDEVANRNVIEGIKGHCRSRD